MEIIQFAFYGQGPADISELVYDSLLGLLIPACRLPWVENIFVPGHSCHEEHRDIHTAYTRLRKRLGVIDEDPDAEETISCMMAYSKIIAMEMFKYGRKFQEMLDSE